MQKSAYAIVLIAVLGAAAITTVVPYLEQVSADSDSKEKDWGGERTGFFATCDKSDDGCKEFKEENGANVNKFARESCEIDNDGKCKQIN
jgi:hypothetical protein